MYSSLCRNCNLLYDTKKVLKTCFKTSRQSGPKMCRKRVVRRLYVALVLKSYNFFRVVKEVACDKIAPCKSTFRYMRTMHKVHFSTYLFSFSILFLLKSLLSSLSVSIFFLRNRDPKLQQMKVGKIARRNVFTRQHFALKHLCLVLFRYLAMLENTEWRLQLSCFSEKKVHVNLTYFLSLLGRHNVVMLK